VKERRRRRRGGFLSRLARLLGLGKGGASDSAATAPAVEPVPADARSESRSASTRKVAVRKKAAGTGRKRRVAVLVIVVLAVGGLAFAIRTLRRQRDRSNVWRLHDEAAVLFSAGEFERALAVNLSIIAQRPRDTTAHFNAGAALLELGRTDEGWRQVERAAELDGHFDAAHMALARRAASEGREDEAVRELTLVLERVPRPYEARVLLAELLRRRGATSRAMEQMRALFESLATPRHVRLSVGVRLAALHGLRAPYHKDAGKERRLERETYARCRELAQELLERTPAGLDRAVILGQMARIHLATGKFPEALAEVEDALRATEDAAARSGLRALRAQIYALIGDDEAAAKELEEALAESASPPAETLSSAADFYLARGMRDHALDMLARAVAAYPKDEELGLAFVRELFLAERPDEAERETLRLSGELPAATRVLLQLGHLRRLRGDFEGAREAYAQALARDPADPVARLRVADTAFDEAGAQPSTDEALLDEAARLAQEVLEDDLENVEALVVLAKVDLARFARTRDARPARKLLLRAVDLDPFSLEAHAFLAYADLLEFRYDEAVLGFERVLASLPEDRPALRVLLARAYLGTTQPERAVEAARLGVEGQPGNAGALSTLVRALRANGDIDAALRALGELAALEPDEILHVLLQAQLRAENGNVAGAEERFAFAQRMAVAIEDGTASIDAQNRVASAESAFYQALGDLDAAHGAFKTVLGRGGKNPDGHVRYGRFLLALGQEQDAEREFQAGVALDPGAIEPRRALADLYFGRRKVTPELIALVEKVAAGHAGDPVVDYLRGKLAFLQGDLRVAADLLTRYVEVRDDDPSGHFALGVVLSAAGRYQEAVASMERSARLAPRNSRVRVALAKTRYSWAEQLMKRGRVREAQVALRRSAAEDPDSAEPRRMLARTLALTGGIDLSVREIRLLLKDDPEDPVALRMLASLHIMRGDFEKAREQLDKLLAAHPEDWSGWISLAAVLLEMAQPDEALEAARRARSAGPDEPMSIAGVIQVLLDRRRFDEARREIDAAIRGDPDAAYYHHFSSVVYFHQERFEDVVRACGDALDREPGLSTALRTAVGTLIERLGDPGRALELARTRAALATEALDMQHLAARLDWLHGDKDRAVAALRALVARDDPYPQSAALLAVILAERGEATAGREVLQRALATYPETPDLHYLLGESYLKQALQAGAETIGDPERGLAIQAFERAFELRQAHPPTLNALAYLLFLEGKDLERALGLSHVSTELAPEHVPYADTKGTVLLAMGHVQPAVDEFRRALGLLDKRESELQRAQEDGTLVPDRLAVERARLGRLRAEVRAHYDQAIESSREE